MPQQRALRHVTCYRRTFSMDQQPHSGFRSRNTDMSSDRQSGCKELVGICTEGQGQEMPATGNTTLMNNNCCYNMLQTAKMHSPER